MKIVEINTALYKSIHTSKSNPLKFDKNSVNRLICKQLLKNKKH